MLLRTAFAVLFLLFAVQFGMAQAAPPLANPVTVPQGGTVHVTPIDQNSAPIAIAQCTFGVTLPATIATWVKDSTGFLITGVAGSYAGVRISCTDGINPAVQSAAFTVTVTPPPYAVTAVGSTVP